MEDQVAVRSAAVGDEGPLARIAAVVQQLHFAERPDVFKAVDRQALTDWFRGALRSDQRGVLLAEQRGMALGYAVVQDGQRHPDAFALPRRWREVDQLAVLPEHRRRGVARALIEHIVAAARADGVPALELNTWAFNQAARETFRRLGFAERSVRYERPVPAASPS